MQFPTASGKQRPATDREPCASRVMACVLGLFDRKGLTYAFT